MSALADRVPHIRALEETDLDRVMQIEDKVYTHPWTRGNFIDSLKAGYSCRVMEIDGEVIGYGVLMIAAHEAHLLNLSVARDWQRRGYGRSLLSYFIDLSRRSDAMQLFLEVRLSNAVGRNLYSSTGFFPVAVRPGYYPSEHGREDAIMMGLNL
jgi:ribosomal-protein-alanine N-acetyltransferase